MNEINPVVMLHALPNLTEEALKSTVSRLVGVRPISCEPHGTTDYLIRFDDEMAATRLIEMHGRTIRGFQDKLRVKRVNRSCLVSELFEVIRKKLHVQEDTSFRTQLLETGFRKPRSVRLSNESKSATNRDGTTKSRPDSPTAWECSGSAVSGSPRGPSGTSTPTSDRSVSPARTTRSQRTSSPARRTRSHHSGRFPRGDSPRPPCSKVTIPQ